MRLGDKVERALSLVGLTSAAVEQWIGRPCGCRERRDKLNRLGQWATRVVEGSTERAREYLDTLIMGARK